ncbi:MAG: hypothetical protein LBU90_04450 [Bacteroidales bacterium]|jgi:hypothetical protein|nr:hypothetical protein [Bacteroidales bacterium]
MGNIKLFEEKQVQSVWNESEEKWYFVVEDIVAILTDSKDPKQYIKRLRQRDEELAKGWVQFVPTLTVDTAGGKQQMSFNDLELIFSMLGEASTTAIVRTQNPEGFAENKQAARQGGKIAGDARKALELKIGESIVSESNFCRRKRQKR